MAKLPTRLERTAQAHAKTATGHDKFLVVSCHIEKGNIELKVDAQKWPVGDFQLVLDMLEDDFARRQKEAALKALKEAT